MGKGAIALGTLLIILGVCLAYKGAPLIPSIILAIIGFALIIFWKAEDTIEQRKDIVKPKTKTIKK